MGFAEYSQVKDVKRNHICAVTSYYAVEWLKARGWVLDFNRDDRPNFQGSYWLKNGKRLHIRRALEQEMLMEFVK